MSTRLQRNKHTARRKAPKSAASKDRYGMLNYAEAAALGKQMLSLKELFRMHVEDFPKRLGRYAAGSSLPVEHDGSWHSVRSLYGRREVRTEHGDLLVGDQLVRLPQLDAQTLVFLNRDLRNQQGHSNLYYLKGNRTGWLELLPAFCVATAPVWVELLITQLLPMAQKFLSGTEVDRLDTLLDPQRNLELVTAELYLHHLDLMLEFTYELGSARGYGPNYWAHILRSVTQKVKDTAEKSAQPQSTDSI